MSSVMRVDNTLLSKRNRVRKQFSNTNAYIPEATDGAVNRFVSAFQYVKPLQNHYLDIDIIFQFFTERASLIISFFPERKSFVFLVY